MAKAIRFKGGTAAKVGFPTVGSTKGIPEEISEKDAAAIMAKWGAYFEIVDTDTKTRDVEGPPHDRMIRKPHRKRGRVK